MRALEIYEAGGGPRAVELRRRLTETSAGAQGRNGTSGGEGAGHTGTGIRPDTGTDTTDSSAG